MKEHLVVHLVEHLVEWSNWKERRPPLGKALELEIKAVFKTRKEEVQVQIENTAKQC